jgi:hypothetical protein
MSDDEEYLPPSPGGKKKRSYQDYSSGGVGVMVHFGQEQISSCADLAHNPELQAACLRAQLAHRFLRSHQDDDLPAMIAR